MSEVRLLMDALLLGAVMWLCGLLAYCVLEWRNLRRKDGSR